MNKNPRKSKRKCKIQANSSQIQPKPSQIQQKSSRNPDEILRKASQTQAKEPEPSPAKPAAGRQSGIALLGGASAAGSVSQAPCSPHL